MLPLTTWTGLQPIARHLSGDYKHRARHPVSLQAALDVDLIVNLLVQRLEQLRSQARVALIAGAIGQLISH